MSQRQPIMNTLKIQEDFFETHIDVLLEKYEGKVLVISNECLVHAFSSFEEAYINGVKTYGLGNFLMRECKREAIGKVHIITPCVVLA